MSLSKTPTQIPGFDWISRGGLPSGTATLLTGAPGSGKTVFTLHYLAEGIASGNRSGVFVTFEESPERLRNYMRAFGWDVDRWEKENKLRFIDLSPDPSEAPPTFAGEFDFGGLVTRIEAARGAVGAKLLVIDSLAALYKNFSEVPTIRFELFRLIEALRRMGLTAIITDEDSGPSVDGAPTDRYGVEDFVVDNLVLLRNRLNQEKRRRTIEVLKYRGTDHHKGEYPFTISADQGFVIIPLSEMELRQESSSDRVSTGVPELDQHCGGGIFNGSVALVTGATGCGKTLMTTQFIGGGVRAGERCLLMGYEESPDQLFRNADSWGVDFANYRDEGKLQIHCCYPEIQGLEDHLIAIKKAVEEFDADRIVIDSLTALERVSGTRAFREFVVALTGFLKQRRVTTLMTLTTPTLLGGGSVTEGHISSIADSIILLRYVETLGEVRRAITVLKMRGTWHDKEIREFKIDGSGMHIGQSFRNISGILAGQPFRRTDLDTEDQLEQLMD